MTDEEKPKRGGWPRAFSESIAEVVFGAIVVVAMLLCAGWRP